MARVAAARPIADADVVRRLSEAHAAAARVGPGPGGEARYTLQLFENERRNIWGSWGAKALLPTERHHLSHGGGTGAYAFVALAGRGKGKARNPAVLQPAGWAWASAWALRHDRCDEDGWQYATAFGLDFGPASSLRTFVRRRVWFRELVSRANG